MCAAPQAPPPASTVSPIVRFFEPVPDPRLKHALARLASEAGPDDRPVQLLCRCCSNPITTPDQAIDVNGAHRHHCVNPAGQAFHIGCFRAAAGCRASDRAWSEHSWFPGYAWRVALCHRCQRHLGWCFDGGDRFFGLILAALRRAA